MLTTRRFAPSRAEWVTTAVAVVQQWVDATLGTTGLADTSDHEAAATIHRLLDAALGLSL